MIFWFIEVIPQLLREAKKPLNQNKLARKLELSDHEQVEALGKRLRATVRDLLTKGVVLVNEEPTIGAAGLPIVFVHPKSCGGVLVELQETPRESPEQ